MKTIGIIGDVHCEDESLAFVLDFLRDFAVDRILCTGDLVDGPGDVTRCIAMLMECNVSTVVGNHDQWYIEDTMRALPFATSAASLSVDDRRILATLPSTLRFDTPVGRMMLCHGLGENTMAKVQADDFGYAVDVNEHLQALIRAKDVQFVVNGHTHRAFVRHFDGLTVINAGTILRGFDPCFAVIDFERNEIVYFRAERNRIEKRDVHKLVPDYRLI